MNILRPGFNLEKMKSNNDLNEGSPISLLKLHFHVTKNSKHPLQATTSEDFTFKVHVLNV